MPPVKKIGIISWVVMMAVLAACASGETNGEGRQASTEQGPVNAPSDGEEPSAEVISVEDDLLVYLPDQVGGKFHTLAVLLRNNSDQVALDVSGQVSILDGSGELVESINPIPINILPGDKGLWVESALDLGEAVKDGELEVTISVSDFEDAEGITAPVSFSKLGYQPDEFGGCEIAGTVENAFSENKTDLQLRVAGFKDGDLITAGFTYVDQVFAGEDATFEVTFFSPAECPGSLDKIGVYPNLGEDKIFSP